MDKINLISFPEKTYKLPINITKKSEENLSEVYLMQDYKFSLPLVFTKLTIYCSKLKNLINFYH